MTTIGFIGFGAMGSRIAKNFIDAGLRVQGYNRDASKVQAIAGVQLAATPGAAAEGADLVIVMVRDDAASKEVWSHPETGAMHKMQKDAIAIDMSTLSQAWTKDLADMMATAGFAFLEAPVVGTRPQAEGKQLVVLAAGEDSAFERAQPVLAHTAAKVLNLKEPGKGAALKLVINTLFGVQTALFGELIQGLRGADFSDEQIKAILPDLPVTSPIMQMMIGLMMDEKFAPLFPIDLVEKDFGYSEEFLAAAGTQPLMTRATRAVYQQAQAAGLGAENLSAMIKVFT